MLESDRKFSVTKVVALRGGAAVWNATAFFVSSAKKEYLITNHHVVWDNDPSKLPDTLRLRLHTNRQDLKANTEKDIPLYEGTTPRWLEHPSGPSVDVVAIPVEPKDRAASASIPLQSSLPKGLSLPLSQDAYVMGYPLGFSDDIHNLAIVRRATIASDYDVNFKGRPCFLVDGRLHKGMSGSPVFARATDSYETQSGVLHTTEKPTSYFLGVFSAEWEVGKEPLGLNTVWRAGVVYDIIKNQS